MSANPSLVASGHPSASSPAVASETAWPSSWNTMPHGISTGRYTAPGFARLEFEKLWSKVWQVAARLDEIPQAGDYTAYDIGNQSIMVVRVDESTVRAYHNVCPHRGERAYDVAAKHAAKVE